MNNAQQWTRHALMGLVLGCLVAGSAWSDDGAQSKERLALRHLQQQMQQLKQDKQALEDRFTALDKEKTELQSGKEQSAKQLSSALRNAKTEAEHVQQLQAALDAMTQAKTALDTQKKELESQLEVQVAKQRDTERVLQGTRDEKAQLEGKLQANAAQLVDSDAKNFMLYKIGRELIDQCRDKSATDVFLRLEPITRIGGVDIENQLESYRDRLDQERRSALGTAPSPAP